MLPSPSAVQIDTKKILLQAGGKSAFGPNAKAKAAEPPPPKVSKFKQGGRPPKAHLG